MEIDFPADSFAIFPSPGSHIRIILPPDSMTNDKISLGDYGLNNLQSTVKAAYMKMSMRRMTIQYKEENMFYIAILLHEARGTTRSAIVIKG